MGANGGFAGLLSFVVDQEGNFVRSTSRKIFRSCLTMKKETPNNDRARSISNPFRNLRARPLTQEAHWVSLANLFQFYYD